MLLDQQAREKPACSYHINALILCCFHYQQAKIRHVKTNTFLFLRNLKTIGITFFHFQALQTEVVNVQNKNNLHNTWWNIT